MFKIINASAGSGKTYTLVKEYLILLFKNTDNYKHILAITFTHKAAAEMKERIVDALEQISEPDKYPNSSINKNMLPEIKKALPNIAEDKFPVLAKTCLSKILHNYSEFSVSTIDSFSHKIIRAFSHEMNIASGFNIELDFKKLIKEAVANMIAGAGNDRELTEFLINYIDHLHENESTKDFERPIIELGEVLSNEKIKSLIEKNNFLSFDIPFFKKIISELHTIKNSLEKEIKGIAQDSINAINQAGLESNDFYQGSKGIFSYFGKILDNFDELTVGKYVSDSINNYHDDSKWIANKKNANPNVLSIKPLLFENFNKTQELYKEYIDYKIILDNIYTYALLNEIAKEIDLIKSEQNILPISEFNTKISDIVAQSEAPFIYERIGEKYNYLMIDEFQDTSILQWQNVIPLIDNSLSNNYNNLIVGDGKQAIYIWRNGEVRQFTSLPNIYKSVSPKEITSARENSFERNISRINLDQNFRSAKTIVNFNNQLFKYFSENNTYISDPAYKNIYANDLFIQKANNNFDGYVEVITYEEDTDIEYKEFNIYKTYEIIKKLHDEYNYDYSDIAILSYKSEQGQQIGSFLLEKGIDVVSPDSLSIISSPKIIFISSIINMLTKQSNDIDLNICIKFLSEQDKYNKTYESLSKSIEKTSSRIQSFTNVCKKLNINLDIEKLSLYTVYEVCEHLIDLFKLNNNDIFIQRFLNIFQENPKLTLAEFPEWFKSKGEKTYISSIEGNEAVNILTIHKSKGLEFPVVICAFVDYKIQNNQSKYLYVNNKTKYKELDSYIIKYSKELEKSSYTEEYQEEKESQNLDKINLLYVALTRAKDQLYVITKRDNSSGEDFRANRLICNFIDSDNCNYLNPNKIENNIVSFGTLSKNMKDESVLQESVNLESIYHNWRTRLKIASSLRNYNINDDYEYTSEEIEWGKKFHAGISYLMTAKDIDKAMYLLESNEPINNIEKERIRHIFNMIIEDNAINELLFDYNKVYIEKEMMNFESNFFRADRITIKNDVYNIIDFKTGKENSKDIKQIKNYCDILRSMGINKVNGYIIYCKYDAVKLITC
ncbi:MAG: UvrD-helicase domain-containing protein [Bacteroidales bacterium]|jgi:ATP-dependent exoDNAse (exonuclease V) beta subunit|nr:UvrD-helicase domain-containing protein [Bacteroidales bacterium]